MSDERILVTGASGFLGKAVTQRLQETHLGEVIGWHHSHGSLTDPATVERAFQLTRPTSVVHLACPYGGGGIGYADQHPFDLASQMTLMDTRLIDAAVHHGVRLFYGMGSVCAYPLEVLLPTHEFELWRGYPEPVNAPYGLAKRHQLMLHQAARKQYGLGGAHLILANLYGPGDKFGTGLVGHVIPATIVKVAQAKASGTDHITAWGDGSPTRSFCYIDDAADAIVLAVAQGYSDPAPINICSMEEISIKEVIEGICRQLDYPGTVRWDTQLPNGQPRRLFSNSRAQTELGWAPTVLFKEGLTRTIDWYLAIHTPIAPTEDRP